MSQTPASQPRQHRGADATREVRDQSTVDSVLSVLEDENCRSILEVTSAETLSAQEIADKCDIALSTTYRKVEKLTEAGILNEQIRLSTSGKHTSEYTVKVEDITVSIDKDSGVQITLGSALTDKPQSAPAGAD
jgi:response regulator of citrate/malate metabolism